jgi:hypothetical protein
MADDGFPNAGPSPAALRYPGRSMRSDARSVPALCPRRRAPRHSGPVAGTSSVQQSYPRYLNDRCPARARRQTTSSNESGGGPARQLLGCSRREPSNVVPVAPGSRIDAIKRSRGFAERTTP